MTDNLDIWNRLGRTDPSQTKDFKRAGGFKGTAIKPAYTDRKMTEVFGPCGDGWGYTEPTFQLVPGPEGQTAVYCWLSVWYRKGDGSRSEPVHGVGGDFAVKKFSSGLTMDDEAFKKAFTDALGNAMRHLGMSADVHMGRFEDSKYVAELKREFEQEAAAEQDDTRNRFLTECKRHISEASDPGALRQWWASDDQKRARRDFSLTQDEVDSLKTAFGDRLQQLAPRAVS